MDEAEVDREVDREVRNKRLGGSMVAWHFVGIGVGNRWEFSQHEDMNKGGENFAFGVDN